MLDRYRAQVRLLIDVLPSVAQEEVFALQGGTAINLFHRDLPRLSVDIDLTYLPVNDRNAALRDIDGALDRIADRIVQRRPGLSASRSAGGGNGETRIIVRGGTAQIKLSLVPARCRTRLRSDRISPSSEATCRSMEVGQLGDTQARQSEETRRATGCAGSPVSMTTGSGRMHAVRQRALSVADRQPVTHCHPQPIWRRIDPGCTRTSTGGGRRISIWSPCLCGSALPATGAPAPATCSTIRKASTRPTNEMPISNRSPRR